MKRPAAILPVVLAAAACGGGGNPPQLWLAPTNGELNVKLIDHEPPRY